MIFSFRRDWPALVLLAAMYVFAAWAWPRVPAEIPVHWGLDGEPDRWGGRFEGLFVFPLTTTLVYALMLVLPRFDPGRANYARFAGVYSLLRGLIVAFFAVMEAVSVAALLGADVSVGRVSPFLTGVLLAVLGGLMGKLRPNWFVGIRTPWTLTSKRAWIRTHRVGGWGMIALGVAICAAGAWSSAAAYGVMLAGTLVYTVAILAYSYAVWRDDPDRQVPGGTTPA
ncbi:MAG: SdpI family protein [Myxococcota bacterium]